LALAAIPILLYHAVSERSSPVLCEFTISPMGFRRQLDEIVASGATAYSVSGYLCALDAGVLADRAVVITFDDGYADFYDCALPLLEERLLPSTLYVATGFLEGRPDLRVDRRPPERTLSWSQLHELTARGVEIGGHSHSHFHLDTLARRTAREEIVMCKMLLEDELQTPVTSFAYPNGHASASVRRLVAEAGYHSACRVRNAFSSEFDDRFGLARLTVLAGTDHDSFSNWLTGRGAAVAPRREFLKTRAFRTYRRSRAIVGRRPVSDFRRASA
jgi:peptidoglycan/xylan/chitin deacetylase (PgdA/CDA1 family)